MDIDKGILQELDEILEDRKKGDVTKSYVAKLFNNGTSAISDKIIEEANELVETIKLKDNQRKELIHETADLWFHTLVLLSYKDITSTEILNELRSRYGISGIEEKENRSVD